MLMGEHAVLYNHPALVAAIDRRITVTLIPKSDANDRSVSISSHLGSLRTHLDSLEIQTPFQFVLAAILEERHALTQGFELWIESEFSHTVGFGSSAAVVVATLAALEKFQQIEGDKSDSCNTHEQNIALLTKAHAVIRRIQGIGSGADAAASIFGGVISYQMPLKVPSVPPSVECLEHLPPLLAIYSGAKVPTPLVIKQVEKAYNRNPTIIEQLFKTIAACTESARNAHQNADWESLGLLMNIHQGLQTALGVSNKILDAIVESLRASKQIYGAKISGAGLGDCVIGLGTLNQASIEELKNKSQGIQHFPISASKVGLKYE